MQEGGKIRLWFPRIVLRVRVIEISAIWGDGCPVDVISSIVERLISLALEFTNPAKVVKIDERAD